MHKNAVFLRQTAHFLHYLFAFQIKFIEIMKNIKKDKKGRSATNYTLLNYIIFASWEMFYQ